MKNNTNELTQEYFGLKLARKGLVVLLILISFLIFDKPFLDFLFGGKKFITALVKYNYSEVEFAIGSLNILLLFILIISAWISYLTNKCYRDYNRLSFDFGIILFGLYYTLMFRNESFILGELSFSLGQFSGLSLKYTDIFVYSTGAYSLFNLYVCVSHNISEGLKCNKELLWRNDNPKETFEDDEFGRKKIAEKIAEQICKFNDEKNSFSIGLVGPWGSGKTTFLYQIKEELNKQSGNDKNLLINFNPWQYPNKTSLTEAFLCEIKINLRPHTPIVGNMSDYINHLFKNNGSLWKVVINTFFPTRGIDKLQESIKQSILQSKKRLIIIIDEIDRLQGEELYEILTIIRNVGNLPNTVFILAYDKDYLIEALKDSISNPQEYLSKFFQVEFALSKIKTEFISTELIKRIKKAFPNLLPVKSTNQVSSQNEKQFEDIEKLIQSIRGKDLLKNIRDLNKLLNALVINWPILDNEVSFRDYLNLEILRLKYGNVYTLIKYKDNRFLNKVNGSYIFGIDSSQSENGNISEPKVLPEDKLDLQLIEFIRDSNDRKIVIYLLLDLFPDNSKGTEILRELRGIPKDFDKSVRNALRFDQYFQNDIDGISLSELNKLREQ